MYDETPNKEKIDWIAARVREIYDYDQLKDCDIEYLYNQDFGVRAGNQALRDAFPRRTQSRTGFHDGSHTR
ncbi:hypothetical protein GCM10009037_01090 [Halarchaeum grantii]|uniref:Uncharacterized protein n=1 Tax=Halarchaeum grantii TaxID=1193105 RepID=A0A830F8H1_9EURY|nr:hypothetical protein GCM10009037_01090 [Halarchaeum grantii]